MVCFELLIASLVQESIDKPCVQKFISPQNSFLLFLIMLIGEIKKINQDLLVLQASPRQRHNPLDPGEPGGFHFSKSFSKVLEMRS